RLWGFRPPPAHGMTAVGMIDAAHAGNLDVLYMAGGNFLETLPEPEYVREALGRVPLRIHQDIVLSSAMLVDPAYAVLLFPAQTRYEQRGGGTETSTERRVYFSPEIPGRRKQFNSMIQGEIDPLLGAVRRDILLSEEDAAALHLQEGDPIEISNDLGSYQGTVRLAPIRPRNVQIYWPEGNVLIRRGVL